MADFLLMQGAVRSGYVARLSKNCNAAGANKDAVKTEKENCPITSSMAVKICSRCKKDFECCMESRGCWCEDLTLSSASLQQLREQYDNCLCPECLKLFAEPAGTDSTEKTSS
jgi:hypothetical protein